VTVADISNDARPDIVIANGADGSISVLLGRGDDPFAPTVTY
jgi:hypothetical protein